MPVCKLCSEEKEGLLKSHIYPEFLYQEMYDENHKYHFLTTKEEAYPSQRPTGIYEQLLCDQCEGIIGNYEDYAADLLTAGNNEAEEFSDAIVIKNVDYKLFKLFQISLIWRTAVATRKEIPSINLGPHEENMREMLIEGNPGEPYEYGCMLFDINLKNKIIDQIIFPPEPVNGRIDGHKTYRSIFAGVFWIYLISSHTEGFRVIDAFLSKEGNLPIFNAGRAGTDFIIELARDFKRSGSFPEVT